jgi:regulator of RNase E activity RraA
VGCVTNGAVRDLVSVKALGFSLFAGSVAVSHSYAHIIDFGGPVEVGGLIVRPGELIHGDRNGVHVIPLEVAEDVPGVARRIQDEERELMGFCRSRDFSLQALSLRMQSISKDGQPSPSLIAVPTPTK